MGYMGRCIHSPPAFGDNCTCMPAMQQHNHPTAQHSATRAATNSQHFQLTFSRRRPELMPDDPDTRRSSSSSNDPASTTPAGTGSGSSNVISMLLATGVLAALAAGLGAALLLGVLALLPPLDLAGFGPLIGRFAFLSLPPPPLLSPSSSQLLAAALTSTCTHT